MARQGVIYVVEMLRSVHEDGGVLGGGAPLACLPRRNLIQLPARSYTVLYSAQHDDSSPEQLDAWIIRSNFYSFHNCFGKLSGQYSRNL
jgi:hypothetical protein